MHGGDRRVLHAGSTNAARVVTDGAERPFEGQADYREAWERRWEDAILAGLIKTTWQYETKVLGRNTIPLIFSQLLGFSFLLVAVLTLGFLGTVELGALSFGAMTANSTGISHAAEPRHTLCAQAFRSAQGDLVGPQLQRMLETFALEIVPLVSSYFGATALAAQSMLTMTASMPGSLHFRCHRCIELG